jgi:hypothetical protein
MLRAVEVVTPLGHASGADTRRPSGRVSQVVASLSSMAGAKKKRPAIRPQVRVAASFDDPHDTVFWRHEAARGAEDDGAWSFQRHRADQPAESCPGRDFLNACPTKVRATMRAVLVAVAAAPPKRFGGGGGWEAMKGAISGWFEVRVDGPHGGTTTDRPRACTRSPGRRTPGRAPTCPLLAGDARSAVRRRTARCTTGCNEAAAHRSAPL